MKKSPQALLITNKSNIKYLSSFTGSSGFLLITKNKTYLFTDFRYIQRALSTIKKGISIIDSTKMWKNENILKENWQKILKRHHIRHLGIEESNLTITQFKKFKKISNSKNKKIIFTDISDKIELLREIKSKKEIEKIVQSQQINEKVFNEIKKIILKRPPLTELDIAWEITELGHKYNAEDVSFSPVVAFGENSASPHHSPTSKKLKKTDVVLIDMGMKFEGYCSDMTRTILPSIPTKKQKEVYALVLKAQNYAINNIKAGITGRRADKFSRSIIEKAGYKKFYEHAGGHGIGLDIHESPALSENYKKKLKANSIITVEPGIYLPGEFGVRIEDMVLIKKTGNKNLTKVKK